MMAVSISRMSSKLGTTRHTSLKTICVMFLPVLNGLLLSFNLLGVTAIRDLASLFTDKLYDVNQDWSSSIIAAGCTLAKKADVSPPPSCPQPDQPVDRETASKLGWKFAPILYQHPLDTSWLTDPARWLNESVSYNTNTWQTVPKNEVEAPEGVDANGAAKEYMNSQSWIATRLVVPSFNATTQEVSFKVDNASTILKKAVVDPVVGGRLSGKVWFTVFRPFNSDTGETIPHAYVFTYLYYYPWNGCSNQVVGTQVEGRKQGVEYYMCPDGIHEGDLEHVKVYVCEADLLTDDPSSAVQRIQLSQHGWLPELDCKAGACNFETDEMGQRRLVVLSGLFSHANWAFETPMYVYAKIQIRFLLNMDGLYIGDRFKKGPVFYPNETNVRFLPYLSEMTEEQKRGELLWATFPGVWGATLTKSSRRTITCLKDNFTTIGPCTVQNPAYFILDYLLKPLGWKEEDLHYDAETSGNTVSGPLFRRVFSYNWEAERESPLYKIGSNGKGVLNLSFDGYCPLQGPLRKTKTGITSFHRISLNSYLGTLTGLVVGSSIIAFAMVLPSMLVRKEKKVLQKIEEDGDRALLEAEKLKKDPKALSETAAEPYSAGAPMPSAARASAPAKDREDGEAGPPAAAVPPCNLQATGADGATGQDNTPSRLSALMYSHQTILKAFQASVMQPTFQLAWILLGLAEYITGVVLGAIGLRDCVSALNSVAPLNIWNVLSSAIKAAFIVFGIVQLAVIITSIWVLPFANQLFALGPTKLQVGMLVVRRSWKAHAVLSGLLVIEMAVTMLMFSFGLMMWVVRYGVTEICVAAVTKLFDRIGFAEDLCVDLSFLGLSDSICGADLSDMCGLWAGLNVDYLSYGCLLLLVAEAMFLVLAATNYIGMRTGAAISAAMKQTENHLKKKSARHGKSGSALSFFRQGVAKRRFSRQSGSDGAATSAQQLAVKAEAGAGPGGGTAPTGDGGKQVHSGKNTPVASFGREDLGKEEVGRI